MRQAPRLREIIRWLRWPRRRPNSIYLRFVGLRPLKASFFLHHCKRSEEEIVRRRPHVDNQSDRFVLVQASWPNAKLHTPRAAKMPAKHIVLADWTGVAWRRRGNSRAPVSPEPEGR